MNSMLIVGLFDGCATGLVYAIAGVTHAAIWAAITGVLGVVPLLGYVGVRVELLRMLSQDVAVKPSARKAIGFGAPVH